MPYENALTRRLRAYWDALRDRLRNLPWRGRTIPAWLNWRPAPKTGQVLAYSGSWRVVESLDQLLRQINEMAPNRSKASDGSIADDQHSTTSDHYPKVVEGYGSTPIVRARDFTHDPADGADMRIISEQLRRSKDQRIKYVIFSRRIFLDDDWTWRTYSGENPHETHMHVSVDTDMDSTRAWQIGDDMPLSRTDLIAIWTHDLRDGDGVDKAYWVLNRAAANSTAAVAELQRQRLTQEAILAKVTQDDADVDTILAHIDQVAAASPTAEENAQALLRALGEQSPDEAATALVTVLGQERAAALAQALTEATSAQQS